MANSLVTNQSSLEQFARKARRPNSRIRRWNPCAALTGARRPRVSVAAVPQQHRWFRGAGRGRPSREKAPSFHQMRLSVSGSSSTTSRATLVSDRQIADGMGTSTKELNLPAKKLIAANSSRPKVRSARPRTFSLTQAPHQSRNKPASFRAFCSFGGAAGTETKLTPKTPPIKN